jgi:hypothetical protein
VVSHARNTDHRRLFSALEELWPLKFVDRGDSNEKADAVLLLGLASERHIPGLDEEVPRFVAPLASLAPNHAERVVEFENTGAVPPALTGRTLSEARPCGAGLVLAEAPGDAVIARHQGTPLWLRRPGVNGAGSVDMSAIPVPSIRAGQALGQYLNRDQFLGVLPLLEFCRRICADSQWSLPDERACFVFDDVNLGGSTYGCVDFRALAASARARGYHAAIGLIPFDARRVDTDTAALFRDSVRELSIVIHGNDHLKFEIARERPLEDRLRLLAEARRRMLTLTEKHGLTVCAVEEPPYGVFLFNYVPALVELGYEAVLCAVSQFLECNPDFDGSASFGAASTECLGRGLAVIPRIPLSKGWRNDAVLAAYLGQPVVIAGHHQDADDGLRYIETVVDFVNGLGRFNWCNPSQIASARYMWRRDGSALRVRVFARRVTVAVPEWAETMIVERAWVTADSPEMLQWGPRDGAASGRPFGTVSAPVPVAGCREMIVVSPFLDAVDPSTVPPVGASAWPTIRRRLAESRDRSYPRLPRFLRRSPGRSPIVD